MIFPVVFRLRCERKGGSLFVRTTIHASRKAMREACLDEVEFNGGAWGRRLAYCTGLLSGPCVADVHFVRRRLGMEVTTHELFHATMAWARRVRFPFARLGADDAVNADEERLTYVHGWLCRQFAVRAWDAGIYK